MAATTVWSCLAIMRGVHASWFPKEEVINHVRIAHGSLIRNNWHREQARDDFLITVDRASALSGAKPISFLDSEK
jgi:hypothetical protein